MFGRGRQLFKIEKPFNIETPKALQERSQAGSIEDFMASVGKRLDLSVVRSRSARVRRVAMACVGRPFWLGLAVLLYAPLPATAQAEPPQQTPPAQSKPVEPNPPPPAQQPPAQQPPAQQPPQEPEPRAGPAEPPPPPVKGEAPATVVDDKELDGILGKEVRSASGENMGRIVDILVNRSGQVRAAIIDFGGFLGVGSRKIAVDWRAIQFAADGKLDRITVALNRNELRLAPEYKKGEPVVVLGAPPGAPPPPATTPPPTTASPQPQQ